MVEKKLAGRTNIRPSRGERIGSARKVTLTEQPKLENYLVNAVASYQQPKRRGTRNPAPDVPKADHRDTSGVTTERYENGSGREGS